MLPSSPAWAVFPGRRLMPARTRVFLDEMEKEFSGPECQRVQAEYAETKLRRSAPSQAQGRPGL
jgi:hypothetical protein